MKKFNVQVTREQYEILEFYADLWKFDNIGKLIVHQAIQNLENLEKLCTSGTYKHYKKEKGER